jgi:hypothetical protein
VVEDPRAARATLARLAAQLHGFPTTLLCSRDPDLRARLVT